MTVCASFPVQLLVLGPADPTTCSYTNSWAATSPALRPATLTTPVLDPGIYWCWIGPSVYSGVPCGSPYWATVTGGVCSAYPCATTPGDLNDDTLVNGDDLQGFVDCVLAGISEPCGCADINGDGAVDLNDVTPFVNLLVGP